MASPAQRPSWRTCRGRDAGALGVVAQGDGVPHEDGIDLVEPPVQAHGAVLHDAAFGLEEEQVVEVEVGTGVTHVFACERPLLERGAPVDAAMGRLVVLALDPGPEAAVERLEAQGGIGVEAFEPSGAERPEEPLDFPLSRWLPGASVDERNPELGAHEGELVRAVVGTVIDVKSQRKSPAGERALEHRQERGGALGEVEGGEGEHAGAEPFLITIAVIIATTAAPVYACARCALPRLSGNGGTM